MKVYIVIELNNETPKILEVFKRKKTLKIKHILIKQNGVIS